MPPPAQAGGYAEEFQRLWEALGKLQRSVQAQQEAKTHEGTTTDKLEDELTGLQNIVAQRLSNMDKKVDSLASEVKELDNGHNRLLDRLNTFLDATAESHKHLEDSMAAGFARFQEREATRAAIAGPEIVLPPPRRPARPSTSQASRH
jgi:SMC interacting uncharacterized protein involved in chromosome segregation